MEAEATPPEILRLSTQRAVPMGLHSGAPLTRIETPAEVFSLVSADMLAAETTLRELLKSKVTAIPAISGYLAAAGGKRIRPLLTALGGRAAGNTQDISRLMCVGEMLHLGSLLHDDVVDGADKRRGQAAAQHLYGNPAVILTGDFCLARAVLLAAEEGGFTAVTELGKTVTMMAEGEVLQLLNAGDMSTSLRDYMEVITKKSASLISWCVAAGAWQCGDQKAAHALYKFGHHVGVAFQITDDVLDYVGDPNNTGKLTGRDLVERKLTLPLVMAMDRCDGLQERLQSAPPMVEDIPELLDIVIQSGATNAAVVVAKEQVAAGLAALSPLPDSKAKQGLIGLAHLLVQRVR